MQTTEYDIVTEDEFTSKMNWKKQQTGAEITSYHNDFLVYVKITFNNRTFNANVTSWTQIGTLQVPSQYTPNSEMFLTTTAGSNLRIRIGKDGKVYYTNTGNQITGSTHQIGIMYPKTSALP